MKKLVLILYLLFIFSLCGCSNSNTDPLQEFMNSFVIPSEIKPSDNFEINPEYTYNDINIKASWVSDDEETISNSGVLLFHKDDTYVNLQVTFEYNSQKLTKSFDITVKGASDEEALKLCAEDYIISSTQNNKYDFDYTLPSKIKYSDWRINCLWSSSNPSIISDKGIFNYPDKDEQVTLTCTFSYNDSSYKKDFIIDAKPLDKSVFDIELSKIVIPSSIEESITLPESISINGIDYQTSWTSSNTNAISNTGKLSYVSNDTNVELIVSINVKNVTISKSFNIVAKPVSGIEAINSAIDSITIPSIISNDLLLINSLNGVNITWESSDPSILSNTGIINKNNTSFKQIKLTATLSAGSLSETVEFTTQVSYQSHMFLDRCFDGEKENTTISGTKLVLSDGNLSGTYTTNIIECADFDECVGSYAATSSTTETCELKVRIRINNKWSKYFTYGEFGKGLQNGYSDQSDTYSKIVQDEIMVTNGVANAFQLQLTLKRSNLNETGPVVTLLALAIDYINHDYSVDISNVPNEVKYDVPKLYQHDVPNIGGSICSITSSTMLMLYRGYNFDGLATYPHQYMAGILKDYGHSIYGNWSYNTIGMSSFGATTYVKRFYSYNEIIHHLCYVGPISASIKGTFVTDNKTYTTNGHLIVITGYKIENNQTYFYINDPNCYGVATRCTLQALENVNRMVSYIIE